MCDCQDSYNEYPSVSIGGPPGDYTLVSPISSCEWLEYQVVSVCSFGVNPGTVLVSGFSGPKPIDGSGASTYNGFGNGGPATFINAHVIPINPNQFIPTLGPWERVSNQNLHVKIRIDGVIAAFVTIRMRSKIIKVIPAPFRTVDPDRPEDMSVAREEQILQAVYGDEGRLIEYGAHPAQKGTVRQFTTGRAGSGIVGWGGARRGE